MINISNLELCDQEHGPKLNRFGHSMCVYNDSILIFGGMTLTLKDRNDKHKSLDTMIITNDLLIFNTQSNTWNDPLFVVSEGVSPPPRHFHTSVVYKNSMYVFGGKSYGLLNDILEYNIDKNTWNELESSGDPIISRAGHTAVVYENKMYVFGGYDKDEFFCNDLNSFDFSKNEWKHLRCIGQAPGLLQHKSLIFGDKMLVFGGINQEIKTSSDLFCFEFGKQKWSKIFTSGIVPEKRSGHVMFIHNDHLFIFGGCDDSKNSLSCDILDLTYNHWGISKSDRLSVYDIIGSTYSTCGLINDTVYLFGGLPRGTSAQKTAHMGFEKHKPVDSIIDLPDDLIRNVLEFLTSKDLVNLSSCCKHWRDNPILRENRFWKLDCQNLYHFSDQEVIDLDKKSNYSFFMKLRDSIPNAKRLMESFHKGSKTKYISGNILHLLSKQSYETRDLSNFLLDGIHCVLLGDLGVGKTSLAIVLSGNTFPKDYIPFTMSIHRYMIELGNRKKIPIMYMDQTDLERSLNTNQDVFAVLFDVTNLKTFTHAIQNRIPEIKSSHLTVPILLVGTKVDLRSEVTDSTTVSREMGVAGAKEAGCLTYIEVSSMNNINIEALIKIIGLITTFTPDSHKKREKCSIQ